MYTKSKPRLIFYGATIISAGIMVVSCSSASKVTGQKLGVARECTRDTPQSKQVEIATIPSMAAAGYGALQCFEKGTRTDLTITAVKVFRNKYGGGSVRVVLTPEDEAKYSQITTQNRGKGLVFMNKKGAIATGIMWSLNPKYGLVISGPDVTDAQVTANAIIAK